MKATIAALFGNIVRFDGSRYVCQPDGTFVELIKRKD
jgi:hypothetical protein